MTTYEALKEIIENTTKGRWKFTLGNVPRVGPTPEVSVCGVHKIGRNGITPEVKANAQFIAISHEALPALIGVSEQIETALREAIRIGDLPVKEHIRRNMEANLRSALKALENWKLNVEGN